MKRTISVLLAVLMIAALLPFGAAAAGEKLIAVTFDDGPSQYTGQLLDGLAARGRPDFFRVGLHRADRRFFAGDKNFVVFFAHDHRAQF